MEDNSGPNQPAAAGSVEPALNPGRAHSGRATARAWAGILLVVALGLFAHREQLKFGFLAHDSYPIVLTSQVESAGDIGSLFTERLMEDTFKKTYYRPLYGLTVALDAQLFATRDARGYQFHSLLWFAIAIAAIFLLAQRLLGGSLAPTLVAACFALNPALSDTLPAVARRPESMVAAFMALGLWALLKENNRAGLRPNWTAALFGLCAMLSKEPALVWGGVAALLVWMRSSRRELGARALHTVVAVSGIAIALLAVVAARAHVLGGLGGPTHKGVGFNPSVAGAIMHSALWPQATGEPNGFTLALWCALLALAVFLLVSANRACGNCPLRIAGATGLLWSLAMSTAHAVPGAYQPWYSYQAAFGFALALGALLCAGWRLLKDRRVLEHPLLAGAAALGLIVALNGARFAPLVRDDATWRSADRRMRHFLQKLEQRIERAPDGTRLSVGSMPTQIKPRSDGIGVGGAGILTVRSLQAWAELRFPERRILVDHFRPPERAEPDQVLVVIEELSEIDLEGR